MQTLPTDLTDDDLYALREVSKKMLQGIISDEAQGRLIERKLIRQTIGGLQITDLGRLCLQKGRA